MSLERILSPGVWEVPSCLFQACQQSRWLKVETCHNIGGTFSYFFATVNYIYHLNQGALGPEYPETR